jgi:hypothetical protein
MEGMRGEGRDGSRECLKSSGQWGGSSVVATLLHCIFPTRNDLLFTFYEPCGMPRHIGRRTQMLPPLGGWAETVLQHSDSLVAQSDEILGRLFGRLI